MPVEAVSVEKSLRSGAKREGAEATHAASRRLHSQGGPCSGWCAIHFVSDSVLISVGVQRCTDRNVCESMVQKP